MDALLDEIPSNSYDSIVLFSLRIKNAFFSVYFLFYLFFDHRIFHSSISNVFPISITPLFIIKMSSFFPAFLHYL